MTYLVEVAPAAARELRKLDPRARRRIQAAVELLAETPRPPAAKQLVNSGGAWRVRVGDYRIVYDIEDDRLVILVLRVGHRREVYRTR
ncbi:type II toxin-antitoxin system RelE/ParE family toxin [Leifsonia sp. NPDC080035]|uniref:Type II toxin-antitoxin system RelE/ParE family toxin n=1 Tax=Leifsonia sp. NPDC080035 TaxID=3143936 RepID=A0AAU7GDS9_9MICO